MRKIWILLAMGAVLASCGETKESGENTVKNEQPKIESNAEYELVLASEVEWTYLNPKRKDKAPMAGTLWGDRNKTEATGFLLKPSDGFQSPPHIHNVSYRGVVIKGLIHNDDPNAENMWMPAGSFWTQPKGEVHITAAQGENTLAYIEIEEGPYLVHPAEDAFHTHERPVNVDTTNIVWLDASDISWIKQESDNASATKAEIAPLWQESDNEFNGSLVKLPAGFSGTIASNADSFKAIVIKGTPQYKTEKDAEPKQLETGSYFGAKGDSKHTISALEGGEVLLYIRTDGKYEISPFNK